MKILIIEDEYKLADAISEILKKEKFITKIITNGEEAQKNNIETFNNIETISIENVKKYGESQYLKGYYYIYSTSLNSDTLTKATDSFEYEVEDKQTTTNTTSTTTGGNDEGKGRNPEGEKHTITNNDATNMYSKSANKIITGSKIIEKLVEEDNTLVTNITPSFILENKDSIEDFTNELKEKGVSGK